MSRTSLRPACAQDLPALADLAAQAMLEDELFAHICPHRYEHYSDFRYGFLRRLKKRLVTPGYVMIVAVENEGPHSELIPLERKLLDLEDRYLALVYPDRSVDPHRLEHYTASLVDCFPFSKYPELWFLATVAVDPGSQRRGIGRQLVQWGLHQALDEKVPVGLEASVKGTALYEKLGFQRVNTVELIPGLPIRAMLYE
ncbi:uncharacterized protein N7515_006041 [Penicillium bovifimosum]|uniref:N-acetyltransferase domain-containing protein n=1 Tax=Penicillium bovifimosum TaxID=126998 RepID=A0A9W9GTZ6_9EURO|nr:uncharacterized protein N7515_006041 [Penicillium bovifimosum]KAJ5130002.1 hypothetical protein N7515_006041 [Penicillium bovifimosum]